MERLRVARAFAQAGALAASMLTVQTIVNDRMVAEPTPGAVVEEPVCVLIPARNEERCIGACLASVLAQRDLPNLRVIVLDDGSSDTTGEIVHRVAGFDPRVKVIDGDDVPPPAGWLGKPWACHRLAQEASGSVLVFIDADVVLEPTAIASAVALMRRLGVQLVSPYPRQVAETFAERLSQPLVNWSWFATLPMALAQRRIPAFSAAIGQFLVVDAEAYRESGGHEPVKSHVVEDVEVLREMKRHGYLGVPVAGGSVASCRMYVGAQEVYEGYSKSLWAVFGNLPGAVGGMAAMALIYVVPPVIALTSRDRVARRWGLLGYAAGVAGRAVVARRMGERNWPDSLMQPLSVGTFAALTGISVVRHQRGTLSWKGRSV